MYPNELYGAENGLADKSVTSRSTGSVLQKAQLFERPTDEEDLRLTRSGSSGKSYTSSRKSEVSDERILRESPSAALKEESSKIEDSFPKEIENPELARHEAVVTPELLVDALSGHEDGLLAIAERLMDHYEGGYDVMGEAIIDAFADVQKLFQHVVEAAHMEGAAFEASRREAEMLENNDDQQEKKKELPSPGTGPSRHYEFIDQDVRDILSEAIEKAQAKKESGAFMECFELYEDACNNASSNLPVDSDHRGRLQLSIARAESMSPERACAILRYAMDDVLRSGNNFHNNQNKNPDPDKRGDCVLKPPPCGGNPSVHLGVAAQSSEEALASLVAEMKEVLAAPVYENSPVKDAATRFWVALTEAQRISSKNEEMLEQNLGKLKGDFLLAQAEWEEKINEANLVSEMYKKEFILLKDQSQNQYMEKARNGSKSLAENDSFLLKNTQKKTTAPSVTSFGDGFAQKAKSLVGSIACYGVSVGNQDNFETKRAETVEGMRISRLKGFPSGENYHMGGLEPSKV